MVFQDDDEEEAATTGAAAAADCGFAAAGLGFGFACVVVEVVDLVFAWEIPTQ